MKKLIAIILCFALMLAAVPAFADSAVTEVMQVVNCNEWVSLRAETNTSSSRLEKVHLGEYVTSCSAADNGFVKCTFDGKTGYILSRYLTTTTLSGWDNILKNQQVVNCSEWVSLRETASTSAARLATVPLNAIVTGCVQVGNFVHCTYNGRTGYILAKYLNNANYSSDTTPSTDTLTPIMYVTNCTSYVTLRASASTSADRLATVRKGALVRVVSSASNGFVKCTYSGLTGYILANYLGTTSFQSSDTIMTNQVVSGVSTWLALRQSPISSSVRLAKLYNGTELTKCVKFGSWIYCEVNGQRGYVYSAYVTPIV